MSLIFFSFWSAVLFVHLLLAVGFPQMFDDSWSSVHIDEQGIQLINTEI